MLDVPIAADVAWCACLLVTALSLTETPELIQMLFGLWTWVTM